MLLPVSSFCKAWAFIVPACLPNGPLVHGNLLPYWPQTREHCGPLPLKGCRDTGHILRGTESGFKSMSNEEQMKELVFSSLDKRRSMELPRLSSNVKASTGCHEEEELKFVLCDLKGEDQSKGGNIPGFQLQGRKTF